MPKLTREQRGLIRLFGKRLAGTGRITLDLGLWFYTGDNPEFKDWKSYNPLNPPGPPDEDTDLADHMAWSQVVKEKFPDDALLDFYVYSLGYDGQLEDNLIVRIEDGKVVKLYKTGTMDRNLIWEGSV